MMGSLARALAMRAAVLAGMAWGLRPRPSMQDLVARNAPGYAIGGLAGGESKDDFWRVVSFCTKHLPDGACERQRAHSGIH